MALKHKSGEHHLMVILFTAMINHLVGMRLARVLSKNKAIDELSYENLYDALALHNQVAKRWEGIRIFAPIMKYVERDKRKRKSPVTARAVGLG
jgi:hypothetical protein